MNYDLTIIIVNYNTANLVLDAVASIKKTTGNLGDPKTEIILVDNGSKDVSKLLKLSGKNIKLLKNDENLGFSKGNNQGIKIARGEYILLLNSDTIVKEGAINKILFYAKSSKNVGVVGARLLNNDGSIQESAMRFPTIFKTMAESWFGKKLLKYIPKGGSPVKVEAVVGAAFLITPEALKKVGMLDERYFFYYEDLDYCRRIKKAGLEVHYLPDAEIVHLHGVAGKSIVDSANQWRRLVPSSKIYNGDLKHDLLFFIRWSGEGRNRLLLFVFLVGLLLRLFLSIQIYSGDVNNHISWAKDSLTLGVGGIYEREFAVRYGTMTPTYPPVTLLLFTISYFLYDFLYSATWSLNASVPAFPSNLIFFFQDQDTLPAFLKIPGMLADMGIALLVFMFVRKLIGGHKWPLIASSLVLFNPAFFYNSAVWGQIEALPLLFILTSFYFLLFTQRSLLAVVLLTVALLVKQTSIIFLPIFALVFYKKFSSQEIVKSVIVSMVIFWMSFLPFFQKGNILLFPFSTYLNKIQTGSGSDYITDHAFNFWSLTTGLSKVSDSKPFLFDLPFVLWGYGIFGVIYALTLYKNYKDKFSVESVLTSITIVGTASFLFLTRMHERYLEQALPFLLLITILKRKYLPLFIIVSLFYLINLYHNWWAPRIDSLVSLFSVPMFINLITVICIGIFLFLFIQFIRGGDAREK